MKLIFYEMNSKKKVFDNHNTKIELPVCHT